MPLPYLPKALDDDISNWSFTNTVSSAMDGLKEAGTAIMAPLSTQIQSAMAAQPQAMPMPQPEAPPAIKGFSLGSVEDWLGPQEVPESATPAGMDASGRFTLPSPETFFAQVPSAVGRAAGAASDAVTSAVTTARGGPPGSFTIDRSSPTAFLGSFRPAAEEALARKGYPTSLAPILAAIPMNEQGYQKEAPGNNYYGIKGSNPRTGANTGPVGTWEDYGGGRVNINDTFRAYNSPAESVEDFLDFLETNPRYAGAVKIAKETGDPSQFIRAVHGAGYATDPAWSDKVLKIASTVPATPARPAHGAAAQPSGGGLDVNGIAQAYQGIPYTFGGPGGRGQGLGATTDCSGFVSAVWKNTFGVDLPAHTDASYNQLRGLGAPEVREADARPGDVVYYMGAGTGGAISHHMGIYAGSGKVLDMSTSGGSGVRVRDVGHGGRYVILRDPRVNPEQPRQAAAPPPIVPTGIAERTGGKPPPQAQVDALSNAPTAQVGAIPSRQPWEDMPPLPFGPGDGGTAPTRPLHAKVATAFEAANGRPPTPEEAAELVALGLA